MLFPLRVDEAWKSMQWYRGRDYDVTEEIMEIVEKKKEKSVEKRRSSDIYQTLQTLVSVSFLRPFSCAGILYILAQWTGISTMVFYMTNIFQVLTSCVILVGYIYYI